jgi:ABC-type nitrate/sulfonate/bicarbonate transport system substrate-binding protein
MFRKAIYVALSLLMLCSGALACKSEPQAKPTISLALANYFNSWLTTYAIREGIITSEIVDVDIVLAADYDTQIIAGKFPMGAMATATFAIALENEGLDFKGISTLIVHEGALKSEGVNILFARADSDISSPADLIGKRVGVSDLNSSATSVFLGMLKQDYGISEDQLTLVNKQSPLLLELLRQGEVDVAMMGGNVSVQAFIDPSLKIVWNLDQAFYDRYGESFFPSILIVEENYLRDNPDIVHAVYDMLQSANAYGEEHIDELTAKYVAEYPGQDADFYKMVFNEHSRTKMTLIEGPTRDILMAPFELVKERGISARCPTPTTFL